MRDRLFYIRLSEAKLVDGIKIDSLVAAVLTGNQKLLQDLINAGANVKFILDSGDNLLTLACKHLPLVVIHGIIAKLLKAGTDVNHRDREGNTPLMLICARLAPSSGLQSILKLFEYGASTDTCNNNGYSPFDYAVNRMYQDQSKRLSNVVAYLLTDSHPICCAVNQIRDAYIWFVAHPDLQQECYRRKIRHIILTVAIDNQLFDVIDRLKNSDISFRFYIPKDKRYRNIYEYAAERNDVAVYTRAVYRCYLLAQRAGHDLNFISNLLAGICITAINFNAIVVHALSDDFYKPLLPVLVRHGIKHGAYDELHLISQKEPLTFNTFNRGDISLSRQECLHLAYFLDTADRLIPFVVSYYLTKKIMKQLHPEIYEVISHINRIFNSREMTAILKSDHPLAICFRALLNHIIDRYNTEDYQSESFIYITPYLATMLNSHTSEINSKKPESALTDSAYKRLKKMYKCAFAGLMPSLSMLSLQEIDQIRPNASAGYFKCRLFKPNIENQSLTDAVRAPNSHLLQDKFAHNAK